MLVVATVLRCRFVWKHFVESHVVAIDAITCRATNDQIVWIAQVADQCRDGDIDNVITKATAIGPTTRNEPAVLERILDVALQHIAAEDAETIKPVVVRIGWISSTASGEASFGG